MIWIYLEIPPPDREPQTPHEKHDTRPVTAVGFASITSKYELSKRNAYSMPCRASLFEPMGMASELLGAVLPTPPRNPSPMCKSLRRVQKAQNVMPHD
jgi:hypothetical protein